MVDEGLKAEGIRRLSLSLVGKIVSNREVNREAFRNTIASIWRTKNEVEVESIGVNLFVFRFGCFWDRKRVLEGGLWSFDKNLLALKEVVGEVCSALLCYERLPNFCFYCGCMGHLLRECHVNKLGVLEAADLKFGVWLRAPNVIRGALKEMTPLGTIVRRAGVVLGWKLSMGGVRIWASRAKFLLLSSKLMIFMIVWSSFGDRDRVLYGLKMETVIHGSSIRKRLREGVGIGLWV
ncbi:hypothetical protein ACOSP7_028568 [Xanthoceras sorbifolium]